MSLRTKTRDGGEDPSTSSPAGSHETGSVDEEEQEDSTDLSDEFESDECDDFEDEPASDESTRSDVPHLASEALFLVGRKSHLGRLYVSLEGSSNDCILFRRRPFKMSCLITKHYIFLDIYLFCIYYSSVT